MKKYIAGLLILTVILSACGHPQKITVGGTVRKYPTVGLFSNKSKDICYEVSVGNVVWSIILIETIVFPVYFIGFSIMNPIRAKINSNDDCTD